MSALLGASSPGRAQVESPAPYEETVPVAASEAAAPEQAPAREPQTGLQEIIVTAQKREENIRDVPIAISVMSGEDLSRSAVSTFDDMARMV
ncbi:MAG TPA: TonB-dependent receptor, partial [Nevskiaceae bacterium]|nr:TonB-dependent receptor [Nevskiaceae bacterium]